MDTLKKNEHVTEPINLPLHKADFSTLTIDKDKVPVCTPVKPSERYKEAVYAPVTGTIKL